MSKHILIVSTGFYPETHGVAEVAYRHALGFCKLGYEVTVLTARQGAAAKNHDFLPPPKPSRFPFSIVYIASQKQLYQQFLQSWRGDIICFHGWHNWVSEWAIPILSKLTAKTILISHGTNYDIKYPGISGKIRWLLQRYTAFTFRKKLNLFHHYVFLSHLPDPQRMSDLIWAKKLQLTNFSIIPNAAKPNFSYKNDIDFKTKFNIKTNHIILCVSNYQYYKGQKQLIEWFLLMQLPNTTLVLIGSSFNSFSNQLQKIASSNPNIILLEKLSEENIQAAYWAATLFASATYTEVQPLVLLDTMAASLPFLCRNVGVVSELKGGLLFQNRHDFEKKLRLLLYDKTMRDTLQHEAQQAITHYYNWESVAHKYHQLFQAL